MNPLTSRLRAPTTVTCRRGSGTPGQQIQVLRSLCAGLLVITSCAWTVGCTDPPPPSVNSPPAPANEARQSAPLDLHGEPLEIGGASWTVLAFVQADCPIANQYVPELNQLRHDYESRGVDWVHIYPDPAETADVVARHVSEYHIDARVGRDPHHHWVDRYRVRVTPEVVVLDQAGVVRYQGRIDDRFVDFGKGRREARRHDLRLALDALLAHQPVEVAQTEAVGCLIIDLK